MLYCLVSDIHANEAALEAVLRDAAAFQPDAYACLGDIIGYGPDPARCVQILMDMAMSCVQGNHEAVLFGEISPSSVSTNAYVSIEYAAGQLDRDQQQYLRLARGSIRIGDRLLVVHGSPDSRDEYVTTSQRRQAIIESSPVWLCACGHTHSQYLCGQPEPVQADDDMFLVDPGGRYLLNPGSVGQPRDGDARAAYALVDMDRSTVRLRRVAYDAESTRARVVEVGLPAVLGDRLLTGW